MWTRVDSARRETVAIAFPKSDSRVKKGQKNRGRSRSGDFSEKLACSHQSAVPRSNPNPIPSVGGCSARRRSFPIWQCGVCGGSAAAPSHSPVCFPPPVEWLNPRPTKKERGGGEAAEDLWRNGVCHGPSSLACSAPLARSTLLSSRAITHIFYDIALPPSFPHLRSSRFAVKRDFPCRRRRPFSPSMLRRAARARQTTALRPPPPPCTACSRCGALVSLQTAAPRSVGHPVKGARFVNATFSARCSSEWKSDCSQGYGSGGVSGENGEEIR